MRAPLVWSIVLHAVTFVAAAAVVTPWVRVTRSHVGWIRILQPELQLVTDAPVRAEESIRSDLRPAPEDPRPEFEFPGPPLFEPPDPQHVDASMASEFDPDACHWIDAIVAREVPKESADREQAAVDVEPVALDSQNLPPRYPYPAWRHRQQGTVFVDLDLDVAGSVREARIAASSGWPLLDRAALDALREWQFEPALHDGRPHPTTVRQPVVFRIDGRPCVEWPRADA
ncbi:MAG: energy transducer TonB [Planctomycetes bacterium]|nr:energy transducer TonB [Planctomycetota bacterium]